MEAIHNQPGFHTHTQIHDKLGKSRESRPVQVISENLDNKHWVYFSSVVVLRHVSR